MANAPSLPTNKQIFDEIRSGRAEIRGALALLPQVIARLTALEARVAENALPDGLLVIAPASPAEPADKEAP